MVKVVFASGADDMIPALVARVKAIEPDLPLYVFSEFPSDEGRWIPYHPARSFWENYACCRAALRGKRVRYSAVLLQPRTPYWRMRLIGLLLSPAGFIAFNENLDHFMLRPRSVPAIVRHCLWRAHNFIRWQFGHGARLRVPRAVEPAPSGAEVAVFPGKQRRERPVILVATPYLPFPLSHGGAVRIFNLMRRAAADYDQVLVAFTGELAPPPEELLDICCEVVLVRRVGSHLRRTTSRPDMVEEFDSPAFHAALGDAVRKWQPAIAQLETTQMAQYATDCAPARTVLVEQDITFDFHHQLLQFGEDWETRRQYKRWRRFETEAWRKVDLVIAMSDEDRRMVTGAPCEVLPNGVDLERFRPSPCEPDPKRLLFIGPFAHLPNILAAEFFLKEVWPLLAAESPVFELVAGTGYQRHLKRHSDRVDLNLEQPGVEVEDFVADLGKEYERATLVVAPLLASAGTKIKILEAMAAGKAVVTTPSGIRGLVVKPGTDVLVAENAQEMAEAILQLLRDPAKRKQLEKSARQTVETRYGWDVIADWQQEIYRRLHNRQT